MEGNRKIGVGSMEGSALCYLYFTYTPVSTVSFIFG